MTLHETSFAKNFCDLFRGKTSSSPPRPCLNHDSDPLNDHLYTFLEISRTYNTSSNYKHIAEQQMDHDSFGKLHSSFRPHQSSIRTERALLTLANQCTDIGQTHIRSIVDKSIPYLATEPLGCPMHRHTSALLAYMDKDDSFDSSQIQEIKAIILIHIGKKG